MTGEKILEVVGIYRQLFVINDVCKTDYPHDGILENKQMGLEHCHGMLDKIVEFVCEGRLEKSFRWLGFIQGFLWANGICTLTDLKNHNRPTLEEEKFI